MSWEIMVPAQMGFMVASWLLLWSSGITAIPDVFLVHIKCATSQGSTERNPFCVKQVESIIDGFHDANGHRILKLRSINYSCRTLSPISISHRPGGAPCPSSSTSRAEPSPSTPPCCCPMRSRRMDGLPCHVSDAPFLASGQATRRTTG